jgi:hypothetical protein
MEDLKKTAAERGRKMGLTYAGALLPAEAHKMMQAGAKLVDVRTKPELLYVGKVPGSVAIEWQTYPGSRENPEFLAELAGRGTEGHAGDVPVPLGRALQRRRRSRHARRLERGLQHPGRLRRATRTPSSTATASAAGARRACRGRRAELGVQLTQPKYAVASTTMPKAMRYQANQRKSCVAT